MAGAGVEPGGEKGGGKEVRRAMNRIRTTIYQVWKVRATGRICCFPAFANVGAPNENVVEFLGLVDTTKGWA